MEDTTKTTDVLLSEAKHHIIDDMQQKEIGAILWDNSRAGFHFIPEVAVGCGKEDDPSTTRIMGLYHFDGELYLLEEDKVPVHFTDFYTQGVEVPPVVVTLSEDMSRREFGDPLGEAGFFTGGTLEEWLAVTDCYFEAINEKD